MENKKAPDYLTPESKTLWDSILSEFEIDDCAGLKILSTGLESYDRAQKAREQIDEEGMTLVDRFGISKPHPLLASERDSRAAFLSALKQLNLDLEPLKKGPGRPPSK